MTARPKLELRALRVRYGRVPAVRDLDLAVPTGSIYAIIGPARSGKTSVLRTINLLSFEVDGAEAAGRILIDGEDILRPDIDRARLRRRVGMVFATPQPLPGRNRCRSSRTRPASSVTTAPAVTVKRAWASSMPQRRTCRGTRRQRPPSAFPHILRFGRRGLPPFAPPTRSPRAGRRCQRAGAAAAAA